VRLWISHENKYFQQQPELERLANRHGLCVDFFRAVRWKALSSAGFAKVDFAKYGFQRT
jgi:hypothetical protein